MSRFLENDEFEPSKLVPTKYGFALAQESMPHRQDVRWLKLPERHIYCFDGDGWYRLEPPEPIRLPTGDLHHG
jgi:quercetin dioxygenase-like cupin family protein